MKLVAHPLLELILRIPQLRRGAAISVGSTFAASISEIALALTLVPILASLGVEAGDKFSGFVGRVPPTVWLVVFAVTAGLRAIANWLSSVQQQRAAQEMVVLLQSRLYRALARAHWDTVRRLSPPAITSALQTQAYNAAYGFNSIVGVITASLLVAGYLISSAWIFPLVLPALLILLSLMWILNATHSRRIKARSEDYVDATTELHQRYDDWAAINRICSLGGSSDKLADRFEFGARRAASHSVNYARSSAATHMTYQVALIIGILIGVPVIWRLAMPPALLIFGLVAFLRVLPRAASIQVSYQGIINAVAPLQAISRLSEQLEADPVFRPADSTALDWKQLRLEGIGVQVTGIDGSRRWIIRDVDLELDHGQWLAVTGPTGAGKTTLADVMLALLRPDAGNLRIDGNVIDDELASRWRHQAAYVPQDVILFDATLRDNLKVYMPEATDAKLEVVLQQAAADFVMTRLPDGLDTRVGHGGRCLSGGERQRIGIARALLRKPGFLVLDEPTAALDQDTQANLIATLSNLDHRMSVVFVTHRPELLRLADRIIGIEDGAITRRDDVFRRNDPSPHHR